MMLRLGVCMEYEAYPHEDGSGDWVVEGIDIDGEGEICTTIFSGCNARRRAEEYASWKSRGGVQTKEFSNRPLPPL